MEGRQAIQVSGYGITYEVFEDGKLWAKIKQATYKSKYFLWIEGSTKSIDNDKDLVKLADRHGIALN